jgi:hypothetical protein
MKIKRGLVIALLAVLGLTIALFALIPIRSSPDGYDPWADINNDGYINYLDGIRLGAVFSTSGTPLQKASVAYDSGWIDITDKCGRYFNITHNLNSMDIIVDITGKTTIGGGIHQRNLGGTGYAQGWSRNYDHRQRDFAQSVVQTDDEGYAVAGYTSSDYSSIDFWLVKTDAAGNMQWNKTYGGTNKEYAYSVVQTSDGGYALAGGIYFGDGSSSDFWLVKTSIESGLTWTDSTANSITLYRGRTDAYWNYVRVRIWKIDENP